MPAFLDTHAFRSRTTDNHVRVLRIVFGALALGVVTFVIIIVAGTYVARGVAPSEANLNLIKWLTACVMLLMVAGIIVFNRIPAWLLTEVRLQQLLNAPEDEDHLSRIVEGIHLHLRSTEILRMAVLESIAIVGLVVCVLGIALGVLPAYAFYWINLSPAALFIAMIVFTFPGVDRLSYLFETYILPKAQP